MCFRFSWIFQLFCCFIWMPLVAQELHPEGKSSTVEFVIKNFGISTKGSFSGLEGTIIYSPNNPHQARFDVWVDAGTVETGIDKRDRHLKSDDYFDVINFPRISIKSEAIESGKQPGSYILDANLLLRGISKRIKIPFSVKPVENGFLFEGSFTLNRLDYKIGSSSISLADQVTVELKILAK